MTLRGDVVIAAFPYVGGGASKNRPAVVVPWDRLNNQIRNTILAQVGAIRSLPRSLGGRIAAGQQREELW